MTRRASRRQVPKCTVPAVAGPGILAATSGTPTASADGLQPIDFAVRQVPPESIKAAGYDGGVADDQTALALHTAAASPPTAPIFFSVDGDDVLAPDFGQWDLPR